MRAELKSLVTIEHGSLADFKPADSRNFCVFARMIIGPLNEKGEESFDIRICTPDWLKGELEKHKHIWGRHMLFVNEWDFDLIKSFILKYIHNCEESDWHKLANKLSRIAYWEFEDYKEIEGNKS